MNEQRHEFRNPDIFQVLPFREYIRQNCPGPGEGYVVEDLDLILKIYGSKWNTDKMGRFMLIELKFDDAWINYAQQETFRSIHHLLRKADPEAKRYLGYFVIQYSDEDWEQADFRINRKAVTREQFLSFLHFNFDGLIIPDVFGGG